LYQGAPLGPPNDPDFRDFPSDPFDPLGGATSGHHNVVFKSLLGWITQPKEVRTVTEDGSYRIGPLEARGQETYALRVRRPISEREQWIWLEFRQPIGFDGNLNPTTWPHVPIDHVYNGALLRLVDRGPYGWRNDRPRLIDFTPQSAGSGIEFRVGDFWDAALQSGDSWSDPYSNLTIRIGDVGPSGLNAEVSYDEVCVSEVSSDLVRLSPMAQRFRVEVLSRANCSWQPQTHSDWIEN